MATLNVLPADDKFERIIELSTNIMGLRQKVALLENYNEVVTMSGRIVHYDQTRCSESCAFYHDETELSITTVALIEKTKKELADAEAEFSEHLKHTYQPHPVEPYPPHAY